MTSPPIGPRGYPQGEKSPGAEKDYTLAWTAWLAGDVITGSTWYAPAGITLGDDFRAPADTTVWISGGTLGRSYIITNTITTQAGRTEKQSVEILIKNT